MQSCTANHAPNKIYARIKFIIGFCVFCGMAKSFLTFVLVLQLHFVEKCFYIIILFLVFCAQFLHRFVVLLAMPTRVENVIEYLIRWAKRSIWRRNYLLIGCVCICTDSTQTSIIDWWSPSTIELNVSCEFMLQFQFSEQIESDAIEINVPQAVKI